MKLTVVGCSGSLPGPDSPASCYLVQAGDTTIVLDLGNGALGPLQRRIGLETVDAVLLSHLHPDHCMDLCGYYVAARYSPWRDRDRIPVWGPAGTADRMARAYGLPADPGMTDEFDFGTYPEHAFVIGDVKVKAARVVHPVPAYALRIEHEGSVLVYSGDTAATPALVDLAQGADLLLCEAAFLEGDGNPPGHHLTGREAGEHAAAANVRQLMLTHILPWGDPQQAVAEARSVFVGPLALARPGAVVQL
ncbi:MAG TPA: MBL fold metallo-hydrolase [Jiangellaceae bacterium]